MKIHTYAIDQFVPRAEGKLGGEIEDRVSKLTRQREKKARAVETGEEDNVPMKVGGERRDGPRARSW
jgi:hypothetical protein